MSVQTERAIERIIQGHAASDGDGVRLTRSIGQSPDSRVDPFLMLDEINADEAADYIGGFPPHPHRGFETVTYMLQGRMRHKDHMGNEGIINSGDVQWMTAARGVIHSEMPEQQKGRLHGFQLWINLSASEKMKDAAYKEIPSETIPELDHQGICMRVIAGTVYREGLAVDGPIRGISTEPLFLDVTLARGTAFSEPIAESHNAFVYVYDGHVEIGGEAVAARQAAVLGAGDAVQIKSADGAGFLLLAARPIGEPVAQYGPFVMNTPDELKQAIADYQNGQLTN